MKYSIDSHEAKFKLRVLPQETLSEARCIETQQMDYNRKFPIKETISRKPNQGSPNCLLACYKQFRCNYKRRQILKRLNLQIFLTIRKIIDSHLTAALLLLMAKKNIEHLDGIGIVTEGGIAACFT